jgi:hypothetical protein
VTPEETNMQITAVRPGPVPSDAVEVAIPMRDGVELAADVYAPAPEPQLVVLVRLPYDKDGAYCFMPDIARYITERGYAVVVQDVRGKFRSGGATEFGVHEVDDGYDTVEWMAAQPWCTGAVAMWGDSYFGMTQLAAGASGHPALKAISPRLTGTRLAQEVTYPDGSRDVEATARKRYFAGWYVDRNAYEWQMDWTARPLRAPFERFFAELGTRSVNFDAEFPRQPRFVGPSLESLLDAPAVPTLFTVCSTTARSTPGTTSGSCWPTNAGAGRCACGWRPSTTRTATSTSACTSSRTGRRTSTGSSPRHWTSSTWSSEIAATCPRCPRSSTRPATGRPARRPPGHRRAPGRRCCS